MSRKKRHAIVRGMVTVLILLAACGERPTYQRVSLSPGAVIEGPATLASPLRVAVAAIISPQGTAENYTPLLDYLGQRLDRPVILVQRQTYAEVNDLIRVGEVDLAFICTGAYVQGQQNFDVELLAVPQVNGQTTYHSYVIVAADSPAQSLADLRGQTFAFTDRLSNTGRLAPIYILWQMGETPQEFFAQTIFTYSHDNSILAVADHLVDGAAVDSLVYEYALIREPDLTTRIRVVEKSPPFGMPPVVVPASLDDALKASLRELLLTMHQNEASQTILKGLMIDRFVLVEDRAYDSVRQMLDAVGAQP